MSSLFIREALIDVADREQKLFALANEIKVDYPKIEILKTQCRKVMTDESKVDSIVVEAQTKLSGLPVRAYYIVPLCCEGVEELDRRLEYVDEQLIRYVEEEVQKIKNKN